ncbi:LexA regulated protein [Edwardsiella anguillarum]|nr:LexA regulated protein [Edwardsiella anguillarum]BET85013.1 LexA regulated protein [Edwardsiella anguillarum]BET88378.1 LexA regulated protein [Edwardsiella anguillarum]BET91668.1 LexA regulated protein [Edwardsiella anguillarum]GAJ68978.1 LexA regulated protein [Edwardsiella piscicida]
MGGASPYGAVGGNPVYTLIGVRGSRAPFSLQYRYLNMAKEQTDRTTLDLFAEERRPGRPKTNPLSREEQLRINKRNQLRRDRVKGLRRVELKMNEEAVDLLNRLAQERNISRSELIEQMLLRQLPLDT